MTERIRLDDLTDDQLDRLYAERDQYASGIRHLLRRIRETAYIWQRDLPETIRTAVVVEALSGIASHVPQREHLRDDLWQRIVGAYYARFELDGHPEDSQAAADEAMSVVQPELDRLTAELAAAQAARDAFCDRVDTLTAVAKSNGRAHRIAAEECERLTAELAATQAERDGAYRERAQLLAWLAVLPPVAPCSAAVLGQLHGGQPMTHAGHAWAPQPGMDEVWCPGQNPAAPASADDTRLIPLDIPKCPAFCPCRTTAP